MSDLLARLRHPKEKTYGVIITIIGIGLWVIFALAMIGTLLTKPAEFFGFLFDIIIFTLVILVSAAWFRAHIYGHYVLLGPSQFPALHNAVLEGANKVGLSPAQNAFLYNSNGLVNAYARRLFGKRFIFLTSALVEADTDAQVNFVIGHELGHHAAGHLDVVKNLLKLPGHFVPFLGPAYSRGRELTCDRVGAYISNDLQASRSALNMLACGCHRLNSSLNCDAFEAQERLVPPFMGWLTLIFSRYPRTTQRVIAVGNYFSSRRNEM
jgi:Zn-dependent protease with chaperone function